eukprot:gene18652-5410_t
MFAVYGALLVWGGRRDGRADARLHAQQRERQQQLITPRSRGQRQQRRRSGSDGSEHVRTDQPGLPIHSKKPGVLGESEEPVLSVYAKQPGNPTHAKEPGKRVHSE